MRNPEKKAAAIQEARQFLKEQKREPVPAYDPDRPWTEETDELFFSKRKRGLVAWLIPKGSPIYFEFESKRARSASYILNSALNKGGRFL